MFHIIIIIVNYYLLIIITITQGIIAELDYDEDGSVNLIEYLTQGAASTVEDAVDLDAGDSELEVNGLGWNGVTSKYIDH